MKCGKKTERAEYTYISTGKKRKKGRKKEDGNDDGKKNEK